MNKFKSIAFAVLYLFITIASQFLIGIVLSVQMIIFGVLNGSPDTGSIQEQFASNQYNLILVALINLILIAGFGSWYVLIRKKRDVSPVPYRKILSAKSLVFTVLLAVCSQFACNIIMVVFQMAFPSVFAQYTELMEGLDIHVLPAWAMIFIVAVWSPLAEELVFRAMVFRTLRKGFSFVPAAILSSVAFGAYHMNWVQGVYAAALGILLAYTYEKTNSLLGCYLFHLAFNLSSYAIEALQSAGGALPDVVLGLLMLVVHGVSIVGGGLLIWRYSKLYAKKEIVEHEEIREI